MGEATNEKMAEKNNSISVMTSTRCNIKLLKLSVLLSECNKAKNDKVHHCYFRSPLIVTFVS